MASQSQLSTVLVDKSRVAQNFGAAAASYDQHAALQRDIAAELRLQWPQLPETAAVIDLGCGTGYDSEWLSQQHQLHAVDIAQGMLDATAARCQQSVQTHCMDVLQLSQLPVTAEALWSSCMLQWATDMHAAAEAIAATLAPGGQVVAGLFTAGSLTELTQAWEAVDDLPHTVSLPDIESTRQAFESAGFELRWEKRLHTQVHFENLAAVRGHLRGLGATNALQQRAKGLMSRQKLQRLNNALESFRQPQGIPMTWNAWLFKAEKIR